MSARRLRPARTSLGTSLLRLVSIANLWFAGLRQWPFVPAANHRPALPGCKTVMTTFYRKPLSGIAALSLLSSVSASIGAQTLFVDSFGDSTVRVTSPYVPQIYVPASDMKDNGAAFSHGGKFYVFGDPATPDTANDWRNARNIDNGYYAIARPANFKDGAPDGNASWFMFWALNQGDYSGSANGATPGSHGAVMALNAGLVKNEFYRRPVQLEPGASYRLSAAFYVTNSPVSVRFEAQETSSGTVLGHSDAFSKWGRSTDWELSSWDFTVPANCGSDGNYSVSLRNLSQADSGNDLYVDDVKLEKITSGGSAVDCSPKPAVTIAPVNDSYTVPADGGTTPSVVANDLSNGNPADLATNASLTPLEAPKPSTGSLLMNADGSITVAAGTTPGSYDYPYQLCYVPATTPFATCEEAIATVVVPEPAIVEPEPEPTPDPVPTPEPEPTPTPDPVPEPTPEPEPEPTPTPKPSITASDDGRFQVDGGQGGTTGIVTENDTLNGQPVTPGDVTLTVTTPAKPSTGSSLVPVLDPATGIVTVPAGTPSDSYTITYKICLPGDASVCAEAVVTVDVAQSTPGTDPVPPTTPTTPAGATPVPANSTWMLVLSALAVLLGALGVQRKAQQ